MSFSHSADEVRARLQTVTRRVGWRFLKPHDLVEAVARDAPATGRRDVRVLAVLRITDVRVEALSRLLRDARYAEDELPREGLPCWSRDHFIASFLRRHRLKTADVDVTRIAFEYVDDGH